MLVMSCGSPKIFGPWSWRFSINCHLCQAGPTRHAPSTQEDRSGGAEEHTREPDGRSGENHLGLLLNGWLAFSPALQESHERSRRLCRMLAGFHGDDDWGEKALRCYWAPKMHLGSDRVLGTRCLVQWRNGWPPDVHFMEKIFQTP